MERVERHIWPNALDVRPDLIFADPPYNIGLEYADDITADRMPLYFDWVRDVIMQLSSAAKPDSWLWWVCPAHQSWVEQHLRHFGIIEHRIIWYETFAQYNPRSFTKDWRFIFGTRRGNPCFNPDAVRIPPRWDEPGDPRGNPAGHVPGSVWTIRRLQGTSLDRVDWHPAQLSSALLERIVLSCTNPRHLVLDAFGGSGNMGVVCRKHGRSFVLVDQSPTYVTKAKERLGL